MAQAAVALQFSAMTVSAGPPYATDDPEPTAFGHYENYLYTSGAHGDGGTGADFGVDFNYGAAADLQLTVVLPLGLEHASGAAATTGLGNVQLAAKYRLSHQRDVGWNVALFPRVFLPSISRQIGARHGYFQLPLWLGREFGPWSTFGGGGCEFNRAGTDRNYCFGGWALTRQLSPKLQLGAEVFHRGADAVAARSSTALGAGARYDVSASLHLLAAGGGGIRNATSEQQYSWYAALLFTL
jgi:hypothetical protein